LDSILSEQFRVLFGGLESFPSTQTSPMRFLPLENRKDTDPLKCPNFSNDLVYGYDRDDVTVMGQDCTHGRFRTDHSPGLIAECRNILGRDGTRVGSYRRSDALDVNAYSRGKLPENLDCPVAIPNISVCGGVSSFPNSA